MSATAIKVYDGEDRRENNRPVLQDRRGGHTCADSMAARVTALLGTAMHKLSPFLYRDTVTDISVNQDGKVWVDQGNGLENTGLILLTSEAETIIRVIASSTGQECTPQAPIISAEIPVLGYRFEGNIPPVVEAPVFSIRKQATVIYTLNDYVAAGIISPDQAGILKKAVLDRLNILVVGGTGSGKTTLANALLCEIPADNRVILIEDTRELQCKCPNTLSLRTVTHPKHPITMRELVRSCMRHNPHRIIIGEVRGGEALDLLKAWNTGHPGGCATIHADNAKAGLYRVEQCILEAVTAPMGALIGDAIDLIVFIVKKDGKRRIPEILRCKGIVNNIYELEEITS